MDDFNFRPPYADDDEEEDLAPIERIATALEGLLEVAKEALDRMRAPGAFRVRGAGVAEPEVLLQDDEDYAKMEAEEAAKDLTPKERAQADGFDNDEELGVD